MGALSGHDLSSGAWRLARTQESVVAGWQLRQLGFSQKAIDHRVSTARLHRKWEDVFAVGRPQLTQRGWWVAALLACGPESALSGGSAMAYYGIGREECGIEISVPANLHPRCAGIRVRRRRNLERRHVAVDGPLRVTNPVLTLVDYAASHDRDDVEQAINDADRADIINPERLRRELDAYPGWNGVPLLREILDAQTFTMTDSELERRMRPILKRVGLGKPLTQSWVNGYRVDFYWPELGLVLETDGLRYHRTAGQQTKDRRRDQIHIAAGLTVLRFTRWQVRYRPKEAEEILRAVLTRLRAANAAA
jgi:very-short-patch-repair endonuclease